MLDDLKFIHEKDSQDALGVAGRQWQYLSAEYDMPFTLPTEVNNVVLAGMGGSAWPALTIGVWPDITVPFEIVRNYTLPTYVGADTLFISSSYSGNTEETLSALAEAEERGAHIVIITAGGKLADIAHEKQYPLFKIPSGIQPRMATFYFLSAFVHILSACKLTDATLPELAAAGEWLKEQAEPWAAVTPTDKNQAKQIALELMGKTPIIYSGPKMWPAANKLKICCNENAKNTAWANQFPEYNHNEFIGWSSHPIDKPFAVVEIRSDLELPRIQKRFEVSERLLSGKRPAPLVVRPEGDTVLRQLLWSFVLADFVTIYLALLNGVNPTPVDLVEKFKLELDK